MNQPPRVYLNTDCFVARLFGHSVDQSTLEAAVAGRPVVTSWYVRLEYFLSIIHGFVALYECLERENDLHDALAVLDNTYRPRLMSTTIKATQVVGLLGATARKVIVRLLMVITPLKWL